VVGSITAIVSVDPGATHRPPTYRESGCCTDTSCSPTATSRLDVVVGSA
jgi:hypothetical protein